MRLLIFATACCVATGAQALPPLACETYDAALVLTLAGPHAQIRSGDTTTLFDLARLPQEHIGWPQAWSMTNDLTTYSVLVDETTCLANTAQFPLRFYMLAQPPKSLNNQPALIHGCCTIAE